MKTKTKPDIFQVCMDNGNLISGSLSSVYIKSNQKYKKKCKKHEKDKEETFHLEVQSYDKFLTSDHFLYRISILQFIRVNTSNMKVIPSLLLLIFITLATSQVIGIDFGTEFWKAALISPGKNLVIVENSRSSRKSHNGIAFLEGVRHFEYDAYSKRLKRPSASYFYLNRLVQSLDHPEPLSEYQFEDGTYLFKEGQNVLTLQQLVGMILKNIKKFGSAQAGSDIRDAVLTVPSHWGFKARMALVNAASLADLSVLGILNENSAAAIHFAITRNDSDAINIGFFNLGSHNLQISIVQFFGTLDPIKEKNIESMRVLAHVSVPGVGGLAVDRDLAEHIAAQFLEKHKLDLHKNDKSFVKLLHKCADVKEVLSANKEAQVYIEGLIDGIDLKTVVKREILQQSSVFTVIKQQLDQVLRKAGITKDQLSAVQIIGGASRIPLVTKIVKDFFDPVQVGSHINGDQSMAFGGALRAANLSIAFRVKQLHFYDGYAEPVRAVISTLEDGVVAEQSLFDHNSEHGLRKEIVIPGAEDDLKVTIFYGEQLIHEYLVQNVTQWHERYNEKTYNFSNTPNTTLIFVASSVTIAELKQAHVAITLNISSTRQVVEFVIDTQAQVQVQNQTKNTETETDNEKKETETETKTEQKDESGKTEKTEEETVEPTANATEHSEATNTTDTNTTDSNQTETTNKTKTPKIKHKKVTKLVQQFKNQNRKFSLKPQLLSSFYARFNREKVNKLKQIFTTFQKHENYLSERAKIRNDFQSTLYSLKDDFDNPGLKTFSTEKEREKLQTSVIEELAWFEENAWTAEKQDFQYHFKIIQRVYGPIVNRSNQYRQRETTYNKTLEVLSLLYQKTGELNESQPWVAQKALDHMRKINDTYEWIIDNLKKQTELELNQNIIFYNHQMTEKAEDLRDEYYLIKMIPRPKTPKKPVETPKPPSQEQVDLDAQQNKEKKQEPKEEEQPQSDTQEEQSEQQTTDEQPIHEDL